MVGHNIDQMLISDLFNRPDSLRFQEGFEFVQSSGQYLDGPPSLKSYGATRRWHHVSSLNAY